MTGLPRRTALQSALFLSSHDYETARPLGLHAIADLLAATAKDVAFATLRPSRTLWHGMTRASLDPGEGTWTAVGRFRRLTARASWQRPEGRAAGTLRTDAWPRPLADAAAGADLIIAQSDLAAGSVAWLRHHAPRARIVYLALDNTDATPSIVRALGRQAASIDGIAVMARSLLPRFAAFGDRAVMVPCGVDRDWCDRPHRSPFGRDRAIVAVAAGALDVSVIQIAAVSHPDVTLHLIGSPPHQRFPFNVREHGPMPLRDAVPFLQHAELGLMAFADAPGLSELGETSPELTLFGHLGVPVVCPAAAAGERPLRAGYEAGRSASVRDALLRAFRMTRHGGRAPAPDWSEVVAALTGAPSCPASSPTMHPDEVLYVG